MTITSAVDPVADGLTRLRYLFVNMYFQGTPDAWVLIDAALEGSASTIVSTAASLFGQDARPDAIILTHGHFDHVGALPELLEHWDVPVYAHDRELPFLSGREDYPPPDPTVGGGAMALLSFAYPNKGIDLGSRVHALPADGSVPHMPEWRSVPVPGHTPGQVAFFRERDRCLIAADAFVTTRQESLYAVLTQKEEVNGPPAYFTPDWIEARKSVERLAALKPEIAATGHGAVMRGAELRDGLSALARSFDELALPAHGRYVPADGTTGR